MLKKTLSVVPLEVFAQENVFYVGYHSTTLINLDPSKVKIVEPLNKEIMNSNKNEFSWITWFIYK